MTQVAAVRVVYSWALMAWSLGVHQDYLVPSCTSAVTAQAQRYAGVNPSAHAAAGERA